MRFVEGVRKSFVASWRVARAPMGVGSRDGGAGVLHVLDTVIDDDEVVVGVLFVGV